LVIKNKIPILPWNVDKLAIPVGHNAWEKNSLILKYLSNSPVPTRKVRLNNNNNNNNSQSLNKLAEWITKALLLER